MKDRTEVNNSIVRLAIPSKGVLEKSTLSFLATSGLKVHRPNDRQYIATMPSLPQVSVLFQRAPDVFDKVAEGSADFGITGFDIVSEYGVSHDDVIVMKEKLGYGGCKLVLAVPDGWVDVASIDDLADLAVLYKDRGKELKIATKYPNLTKEWMYDKGIVHFSLVAASGALEVAPRMGYADLIADITSTGTTLRENRLKTIDGGTILQSEACLIASTRALRHRQVLSTASVFLELIEARMRAQGYISITANIQGESELHIAKQLVKHDALIGLKGPSISKVYSTVIGDENWFAVTIIAKREKTLEVIHHLRKAGGADIAVSSLDYLFDTVSWEYEAFLENLKRERFGNFVVS